MELDLFGEGTQFDHIGIAVRSIEDIVGGNEKTKDDIQKVCVSFFDSAGVRFELVEPACEDSPVTRLLKNNQSLYHVCFRVDDINASIKGSRSKGFHLVSGPVPAVAFGGKKIAWLFSRVLGLVELVEK